jgi:hypothetical protein
MRMPIHRVRASPHTTVHIGPAARVETQGRLGRPYGPSLMGVSCASDVIVAEEAVRERHRLAGHLQRHPPRVIIMVRQHVLELLENALQLGQVVSRVARGPVVVRPGAVALGSGGLAHAVLLSGLSLLEFVVRLLVCRVLAVLAVHPRHRQRLQAAARLAGLCLPQAPLRELRLRLLPARPRPGRVLELDA